MFGRCILALIALTGPAFAWEFNAGTPCVLRHVEGALEVELTFQPQIPLYTLAITRSEPWSTGAQFAMEFIGPQRLRIATDRHVMSADRLTVSVKDAGFGNVLNGLQFNHAALVTLGETSLLLDLSEAAGPTRAVRTCESLPAV